jgi:hypothetical protein
MTVSSNQSFLDIHQQALSEVDEAYHSFLLFYRASSKYVYGFCEGKDDPHFYHPLILGKLPGDWLATVIPAGGKDKVIRAYNSFDWNRFSNERICFFVDRDLDDYLDGQPLQEANVYITDGYSIENSIFDSRILVNVLSGIYQVKLLSAAEEDKILEIAERNLEAFTIALIPIMAQILIWKRSGVRANYKNIKLDDLFRFQNHEIIPETRDNLLLAASRQSGKQLSSPEEIINAEEEISRCEDVSMVIRGKYIAWFIVKQCENLWANISGILEHFDSSPNKCIEFGHKNANVIYAPRARIPDSLSTFLDSRYCKYILGELGSSSVRG